MLHMHNLSYFFAIYFSLTTFRGCLFPGKWFLGNQFPNFPVFVCHWKSWSTENTFRSTENTLQSKKNLAWFPGKCFP